MDNSKTGALIRARRKELNLTQKELAERLHITDRAVSKWERGLCAPDIALLEPLGDILGLSVTELISGERKPVEENSEQIETAVKETISYSQKEMLTKNRVALRRLTLVTVMGIILSILICLGILWYKGMFHILGRFPSPDGTTVTTVFDCRLGYGDPPSSGGFTLADRGRINGRTIYEKAEFKGLWWAPNGRYQVVSMCWEGENYLSLADFTRNVGVNLSGRLENTLYNNNFFQDVPYNSDGWREISFDFVQWSEVDPEKMLVYFSYTDTTGRFREGYMWYDYESGKASGEMEIEQDGKESNPVNDFLSG